MEFLVLRLYGPLAAWGDVAVGEQRPSYAYPSRSAILGLVAAALGFRRDNKDELAYLNENYGMAIMVEASGEWLRDYHTAQVPPAKHKVRHLTRREELQSGDMYTILSQRDYLTDSCCSVALWCQHDSPAHPLEKLKTALIKPSLPLYLGRKSCPPALPLSPEIVEADSLVSAFENYHQTNRAPDDELLSSLKFNPSATYYWEQLPDGVNVGIRVDQVRRRRDKVLNRQRWQFGEREEYTGTDTRGKK